MAYLCCRGSTRWIERTVLALVLFCVACASPNRMAAQAPQVSYTELKTHKAESVAKMTAPPYVLAFKAGDEIPFNFALESKLVELDVPPLTIKAKQDFWVLIRPKGAPLVSLDGKDFTTHSMNSFMFGIRVVKDEPTSIQGKMRYRAE